MTINRDNQPPSPCIGVCKINAQTALCEGCLRTLDEITAWSRLTPEGKRRVLAKLDERNERITNGVPIKSN